MEPNIVIVAVIIGVFTKRYLNKANATVKKLEEDQKAAINISFGDLTFGRLIGRGNFGEGTILHYLFDSNLV